MPLYPLRFQPIFRRYLWGGRRLESILGKGIGEGNDYAESWEVVDHGRDQSVVTAGPLAGRSLRAVREEYQSELFGRHAPQPRFPLLFKFLDAHRALSVQVHPNDKQAATLTPPDFGKTEAWVVLHAEPESVIYAGLKPGVDRAELAAAVAAGRAEDCLHEVQPVAGDCFFIPAGTVHALGGGLVIAEIQQSSDTTFRLSDWNRVGPDGKPRTLHAEQALEVIDFRAGPVKPQVPKLVHQGPLEQLVACDQFELYRVVIAEPFTPRFDDRFHLIVLVEGSLRVTGDPTDRRLTAGECALLPAACIPDVCLEPEGQATLLDIHLP